MDVPGFSWFSNGVFGELIKKREDNSKWIVQKRQRGNNVGKHAWLQNNGPFAVVDTQDYGVLALSKLGIVDKEFKTPAEAMDFCESADPEKLSYQKD